MPFKNNKKIYLVEPDSAVRDSIKALFESFGLSVDSYSSGRSFLINASVQDQECVLAENELPTMSGMDLHEQLQSKGIDVRFILLSSANDAGFEKIVSSQDIVGVIRKPIRSKHLLEVIKSL